MPKIDWLTVRTAASAGLMIIIPAALVSAFLVGEDGPVGWSVLFVLLVLLGFFVAGFGAGRLRNDTPMMHGSLAAMSCYAVVQIFGTIRRLSAGESIHPITYPLFLMIAAALGIAGAVFADWSARKTARMQG